MNAASEWYHRSPPTRGSVAEGRRCGPTCIPRFPALCSRTLCPASFEERSRTMETEVGYPSMSTALLLVCLCSSPSRSAESARPGSCLRLIAAVGVVRSCDSYLRNRNTHWFAHSAVVLPRQRTGMTRAAPKAPGVPWRGGIDIQHRGCAPRGRRLAEIGGSHRSSTLRPNFPGAPSLRG